MGHEKSLLRFITCGSVDDGKSTLIGRLLYEGKTIPDDQLSALKVDSQKFGTTDGDIDYALLVDGLESEREQGITIDVAYRYFETEERKFIVADTPGHEQYTRNMATGASTADAAVILIDARKGVVTQTKRHTHIAALLGIRHMIVAINKMDLVDYNEGIFQDIANDYQAFIADLGFQSVQAVPLSARYGDNVISQSDAMKWYSGKPLLKILEDIDVKNERLSEPFRFPVQSVNRPDLNHRSIRGTVAGGAIEIGDKIFDKRSGQIAKVTKINNPDGEVAAAQNGDAIDMTLDRDIDISRGHVLSTINIPPKLTNQIQAHVIWFDEQELYPSRRYIIQTINDETYGSVTEIKYKIDINTAGKRNGKSLTMNDIAVCNLSFQAPLLLDPYKDNQSTGAFVMIDPKTNKTVGAGMVDFSLYRADNLHWHDSEITGEKRAALLRQTPKVLWLTGLYNSGKSDIAQALDKSLHAKGLHTYILNGDNMRHGLCRDLGFETADRIENIRRVAEVAKLMADSGLIVICSFISPFAADRDMARRIIGEGFVEIFVDTPLETCIVQDKTGLYERAIKGEVPNVPGINSEYEVPENPDIHLKTNVNDIVQDIEEIENYLQFNKI